MRIDELIMCLCSWLHSFMSNSYMCMSHGHSFDTMVTGTVAVMCAPHTHVVMCCADMVWRLVTILASKVACTCTYVQSLRQSKARQLRLKTTPPFPREKEELPQAGFEPTMFCVPQADALTEPHRGSSAGQAESLNVL